MERPIIFSAKMIKLIIKFQKTQTRRAIKPQPPKGAWPIFDDLDSYEGEGWAFQYAHTLGTQNFQITRNRKFHLPNKGKCPYGVPDDILWVRETWADLRGMGFENEPRFAYKADICPRSDSDEIRKQYGVKWRSSIHMPREAARLFLLVKNIRVEKLQTITKEDAKAEGAEWYPIQPGNSTNYVRSFADLWDSTYARKGYLWNTNPWVWCLSFEKL